MYIFNRWGAVLFSSNEPNPKWDGRFQRSRCCYWSLCLYG
ncbi:MAG: hypothetical protein IPI15_18185 [Saprospiraceae bacterium]|nr:hypothetical protein [Candidatus Brachybacter algidus]